MRLATIRTATGTAAVRLDGDSAVEVGAPDVGTLLSDVDWRTRAERATGARHDLGALDYAPLIPRPEKVVCVGLNYRAHIIETGRDLPGHPTLFSKYPQALVGAYDDVVLPQVSQAIDWEAELAVVVGASVRHATPERAEAAIAGYAVLNDVTVRDWQYRTTQWLAGKTFEATTPFGPMLVTPDELDVHSGLELVCEVNGEAMQRANTADLLFPPGELVGYLSRILTLSPGDVVATGTPGGVGHARTPPRYLADGDVLTTRIAGLGECRNRCRPEKPYSG